MGMSSILRREPEPLDPKIEEIKVSARKSLWFLCTQFLGYKDWDKVHDDIEILLRKPARKKAILIPRNHLKSSIVTIGYTVQRILQDPEVRILIGNGVWDMSRKFLDEIKAQLDGSQLKYLFGNFVSEKWNADEIIVKQRRRAFKEPTIMTTGIEAETTGGHYDLIILDDLVGLQNSNTPEQRQKAKKFRRSMVNLLEPRNGMIIEIGTRWHLDDTFSEIFEKEMKYYDVMVREVVEEGRIIFPKKFAKKFDAVRKDWVEVEDDRCMDYIEHLKESMPLDEFSAQYLNKPFSSESQLFKGEMFKYWYERPKDLYLVMAIDLAISESKYSDDTAITVMGMDREWRLYVMDYINGKWKPSEVISRIFEMREKWKPQVCAMEVNGWQKTLKFGCEEEMRKRKEYFVVEEIRTGPESHKVDRIKLLEPFYRRGDMYHAAWMKGKELEGQLQTFPKGKRDDVIDTMSMALPFLQPGSSQQAYKEDDWDVWIRRAQENSRRFEGFFEYGK